MLKPTVRLRLSVFYTTLLALILSIFSAVLFLIVSTSLRREVDQALWMQAQATAESVFAFWRAERTAAGSSPGNWVASPPDSFLETTTPENLTSLINRWAQKTGGLKPSRSLRLLDKQGQILGASESFAQWGIPVEEGFGQWTQLAPSYRTLSLGTEHMRVITYPVVLNKRVGYFIEVAASLKPVDLSLTKLRLWTMLLVPAVLLVVGALSYQGMSMVLSPVHHLLKQALQFMEGSLHAPMRLSGGQDEIEQLAGVFDSMLNSLDRSMRRLRQFSAAAAHELRNVLTVMKGDIGVALRRRREAQEYEELLKTHYQAIGEMVSTVEQLLNLARWEAAEDTLKGQPVELARLVGEVVHSFEPLAQEKEIVLKKTFPMEGVWTQAEPLLLKRVFANLLDNALKNTPPKGAIDVRIQSASEGATVSVEDSGPGIAEADLARLFDKFFKPKDASDAVQASGLGLGICRWIIEAHHGQLEVSSLPGAGATFTVYLPLCASQAALVPASVS